MRGFADRERSLACLVLVLVGFVAQDPSPSRPATASRSKWIRPWT
jgi:hypothetical protein